MSPRTVILGGEGLLDHALKELDEARDWMVTLGRSTAKEKVASFLCLIATHIDPENETISAAFELPPRRAETADFLDLTTETVSRQINRFCQSGLIRVPHRREIAVPDMERRLEEAGG